MRSIWRAGAFRWLALGCTVGILALATPGLADWPQWRGPDGAGVAAEAGSLPATWEPGAPNIRWQTPIRGEGISSPVASNGRVFVTTAHDSAAIGRLRAACSAVAVALGALFLYLFWRGRRLERGAAAGPPAGRFERWERRIGTGVSLFFVVAGTAMAARPELFFEVGNPGRAWRTGGAIALLGLAAGFGWFERRSPMRLLGMALVSLGAATFLALMPPSSHGPTPLSKSLPFAVPALALALLHLVGFVRARRSPAAGSLGERGSNAPAALTLVALAALVYAPVNLLTGLERVVVCLDQASGEVVWERTVLTSPPEKKWDKSTYATPTPATDGELVFAYFGHGLAALDFEGTVLWRETFPDYSHHTRYGAAASPVLERDSVILGRERELDLGDSSWIGAWEKSSGRRIWWRALPDAHDSYTTPMLVESEGGTQLLTASWNTLVSYDAASGERLWAVDYPMEQMVASMARSGELVAVTGGAYGDRYLMVFRLGAEGSAAELVWKTNRGVAAIASPVFYDGKLFTVSVPGIMTVYEAETGRELWKKRLDGEHFASLVAGDGKVYATSVDGSVTVVSASEPDVIAVNDLDAPVYSSPAIAGGCLLVRTARSLYCIEGEGQQARAIASGPSGGS